MLNGFIALDKPAGISSFAAVQQVKKIIGLSKNVKIGHAGTLDPFATGLLVIAIGEATKLIDYVMHKDKIYEFSIKFGIETDTLDITGAVVNQSSSIPSRDQIEAVLPEFIGNILQTPPKYSAVKINGKRAYDLARSNQEFEIKEKEVICHALKLKCIDQDSATLQAHVGKGFYIRSLVKDISRKVGAFGTAVSLRRIKTGVINEDMMISLDKLEYLMHNALQFIIESSTLLDDILVCDCSLVEAKSLYFGRTIKNRFGIVDNAICMYQGHLVAIVATEPNSDETILKPKRVFNFYNFNN